MQVDLDPSLNEMRRKELRKELGFSENPVPYDEGKMKKALARPEVKQVRVFRLKQGMRIEIQGAVYKVIRARDDGKVVMKLIE